MSFADLVGKQAVRAWFNTALEEPAKGIGAPYAIIDRNSGTVLGSTSLYEMNPRHKRCELGRSWLVPSARRTGVNTRAKLLMLTYAFETLEKQRVQVRASAGKKTSRAAIESLGAKFEGILRNYSLLPGGIRTDAALFSIVAEEWPQVKETLLSRLERPYTGDKRH